MYLAGAAAAALPGGSATTDASASATICGIAAKYSVLATFGLLPAVNWAIARGKASWQQFWSQPMPEILCGIWQAIPIWLIVLPQQWAQGPHAGAPILHGSAARAGCAASNATTTTATNWKSLFICLGMSMTRLAAPVKCPASHGQHAQNPCTTG